MRHVHFAKLKKKGFQNLNYVQLFNDFSLERSLSFVLTFTIKSVNAINCLI